MRGPLDKLKEHDEDMMVDDLLEWMEEKLSAENIELITKSLEIEKKDDWSKRELFEQSIKETNWIL